MVTLPLPPSRGLLLPDPHDPPGGGQPGVVKEREMRTPPAPPWTLGVLWQLPRCPQVLLRLWAEAELKLWLEFMVPSVYGAGLSQLSDTHRTELLLTAWDGFMPFAVGVSFSDNCTDKILSLCNVCFLLVNPKVPLGQHTLLLLFRTT